MASQLSKVCSLRCIGFHSIVIPFFLLLSICHHQAWATVGPQYSCGKINETIDSIFTNELEETDWTREMTPELYDQLIAQDCDGLAKILTLAGILYYNDDALIKARHVFEQADSLFQLSGTDNTIYVRTQLFRGLIDLHEGNHPKALIHFQHAVELSVNIEFPIGELQGLINQALVYHNQGQTQQSKDFLFKARQLTPKTGSDIMNGYVFLNLGRTYLEEKEYTDAEENFVIAQDIWTNINYTKGLYFLESNYANLEKTKGAFQAYETHLKNALILLEQDSSITRSGTYIELGKHYANQNNEQEAIYYFEKAIEKNEAYNEDEYVDLVSNLLALYGRRNDTDKIRELNQKVLSTYRNKFDRVANQAIKWKRKDFILESKLIENETLKKAQEEASYKIRNRNILLSLLAATFILVAFLVYMRTKSIKLKEQLHIEQLRTKISKDLHDDVGTLLVGISMQSQILPLKTGKEQEEIAKDIVEKSAEAVTQMRDMVWAMDARNDSFVGLEYKMKDYLATIRSNSDIAFSFINAIPDKLSLLSSEIKHTVYLIFKESINNEIKHSDASKIDIQLSIKNKELLLTLQDNGPEKPFNKSGQGLKNMTERAEQVGGKFSFSYVNGYQTILSIPLPKLS